jgi:hypothetical protein
MSEYQANLDQQRTSGAAWLKPAPVRHIVKRTTFVAVVLIIVRALVARLI